MHDTDVARSQEIYGLAVSRFIAKLGCSVLLLLCFIAPASAQCNPPGTPNLTATATGFGRITLTWNVVQNASPSYGVYMSSTSASSGFVNMGNSNAGSGATSLTRNIDSLSANRTYYFYVVAYSTDCSPNSQSNVASATTPDLGYPALVATAAGFGQIRLTWSVVENAAPTYQIYMSDAQNGYYYNMGNRLAPAGATTMTTTFDSLRANQTYYFYVVASGGGVTHSSNIASATTPDLAAPVIKARATASTWIVVTWKMVEYAAPTYSLYISETGENGSYRVFNSYYAPAGTTSLTASVNVGSNRIYYFYVAASGGGVIRNSKPAGVALFDFEDLNSGVTACNSNVGLPVNVTNGNMYLQQTDYSLPGAGTGGGATAAAMDLTRTYNSQSQRTNLFGKGWSTAYDESVRVFDSNLLRLYLADGRGIDFSRTGSTGAFLPMQGDLHGQMTQQASGFALTLKDGSVHQFNTAGKLLSVTDRYNNQTSLNYDASGKLASVTDSFGRTLVVTSDAQGRILSVSDAAGVIANYTYGSGNELLSVTYPDNSKFQFTYTTISSKLLLTTVTDALGHVVEAHAYDSTGRATTSERQGGVERYTLNFVNCCETQVTDAQGNLTKYSFEKHRGRYVVTRVEGTCACGGGANVKTWTYDDSLNVLTKTTALNQTTIYTYDANGNQITRSDAVGTTRYTYNGFGQVLTVTDPMQGVTTNTYDATGNLLTTKDALNNTTTFTYDTRGLLLTVKDARNNVTTLTWDTSGRLTEVKDAANNATTYAYDARSRVTTVTNALNEAMQYEYDAAGRPKKVVYPDASYVQYTYDLDGRRTKIRDARGNETNLSYDSADRLTGATNAANKTTGYNYNLMSRLTGVTDALNRTTNYEYDNFHRLVKTIHPPATPGATRLEERIAYDAVGNVKKRIDTAGRETVYDYDAANRLVKATDPTLQVTQYEYNPRSQMTAVVDALNQRYTFAYDPLGRITQVTRGGISMSYAYDAVGNRTGRTDYNNATTNYAYDHLNRLTTVTYPDATTVSYAYDQLSRLSSAANANGTVSFGYDSRGRVGNTTDVFNQTVSYAYDANNNRTQLTLGQTANAIYQYDVLNRLMQITDSAGASIGYAYDATDKLTLRTLPNGVSSSYQYDGINRLTRLTDATSGATVADAQYQYNAASQITQIAEPTRTRNFSYDAADRLTAVQNPTQTVESYAYDGVGNRTASHQSSTYAYQSFNKVVTIGSNSYSYDSNGNLTSKTDASGVWLYSWDYENRLKQVTRPDSTTISYKYDALGRRVQRTPGSGVSTNYVYDGQDVVKDINSDGSTVEYLNGEGIDNKIRQTSSTSTLYFSQDHLGSTRALTDSSGNVVESVNYDSFGSGASTLTRYGYTGREWDAEANLYYYRNRWYDPQIGRFISEDPIGLEGGINLYAYVENNPLNKIDPSGLNDAPYFYSQQGAPGQSIFDSPLQKPSYPWVYAEAGGGGQYIWGVNGAGGRMWNLTTGEKCYYVKACGRFGFGLIFGGGGKVGGSLFGPQCGKDAGGWSFGLVGELASPTGGAAGSIDIGESVGGGANAGPEFGLGFSLSCEVCYTKILVSTCSNTPPKCR